MSACEDPAAIATKPSLSPFVPIDGRIKYGSQLQAYEIPGVGCLVLHKVREAEHCLAFVPGVEIVEREGGHRLEKSKTSPDTASGDDP